MSVLPMLKKQCPLPTQSGHRSPPEIRRLASHGGRCKPDYMRISLLLACSLVALVLGCSNEQQHDAITIAAVALPTAANLPTGVNESCACIQDGSCATIEERLGSLELRNLTCRWLKPNSTAYCTFEQRFVPLYPDENGKFVEAPEAWQRQTLRSVLLPSGGWCSTAS